MANSVDPDQTPHLQRQYEMNFNIAVCMANSVDPDQTPSSVASDLVMVSSLQDGKLFTGGGGGGGGRRGAGRRAFAGISS